MSYRLTLTTILLYTLFFPLTASEKPPSFTWHNRIEQLDQEIRTKEKQVEFLKGTIAELEQEVHTLLSNDWEKYAEKMAELNHTKKQTEELKQEIEDLMEHRDLITAKLP